MVPLDGSPQSEAALPYAVAVATTTVRRRSRVTVVETVFDRFFIREEELNTEAKQSRRERAEAYLAGRVEVLRDRGIEASAALVEGEPSEQIRAAADALMRAGIPTLLIRPAGLPVAEEDASGRAFGRPHGRDQGGEE